VPSRLLTVYLFAVILVSGVWIGTPGRFPLIWIAALAVGAVTQTLTFRLALPDGLPVRANARDALLAIAASAPALVYLIATWRQEFPYLGDQWLHNAGGIEAYEFWWPFAWIVAAAAIASVIWRVRRHEDSPAALIALAAVVAAGLAMPHPLSFAGRYPGTLHFFSVPLRVMMHATSPLNVERLLNALSIPIWLLVLRPLIVRRHVDIFAITVAAMLFWQKDNAYYFTSGYLEPWAIVLLLVAAEHLVRFESEAVWRPLLLLGSAAMVKEQLILGLPIVAAIYFPFRGSRRAQAEHVLVTAVAATPFALFWRVHELFKSWAAAAPVPSEALSAAHFALFRDRIALQFGIAIPLVLVAVALLILFAVRLRAFAALACTAAADFTVIYFARILQPWAGYPRLNLVPLAFAAVALGYAFERLVQARTRASVPHVPVPNAGPSLWSRPRVARTLFSVLLLLGVALNCIPLVSAIRDAFRPSSARSFIEHSDAPLFFPIREAIEASQLVAGSRIDVLTDGKRIFQFFWPGPLVDQYPDLAARYRLRSASFTGNASRCRCIDPAITQLAVFIRFTNLGTRIPQRDAIAAEAQQCEGEIRRTCKRVSEVRNENALVGLVGAK
jgi:hypothetical protein